MALGNIMVICRIRPLTSRELLTSDASSNVAIEPVSMSELGVYDSRNRAWKSVSADRVLGCDMAQADVFAEVRIHVCL